MTDRAKAKDRAFVSDEPIRNTSFEGRHGYTVRVRLTSYRALPLSCIEAIELRIDGNAVPSSDITFVLNGVGHKLSDLGAKSSVWWWILDYADLFVSAAPLVAGDHDVEGALTTVEPYITAGRFSFYNASHKRLLVAEAA